MSVPDFYYTSLIADDVEIPHRAITIVAPATALPRGSVMGLITLPASAASAAKAGGNTGNGTLTPDVTTPVLANSKAGVYQVRFTSATAFRVTDPEGRVLGDGVNGTPFADQFKFVTAAGGTPFVAGDGFDVTLAAGAGKYALSAATATDGSQDPNCILAFDVPVSGSDVVAAGYFMGSFVAEKLTFGTGHTAATVEASFRRRTSPIVIKSVGAIAYPT